MMSHFYLISKMGDIRMRLPAACCLVAMSACRYSNIHLEKSQACCQLLSSWDGFDYSTERRQVSVANKETSTVHEVEKHAMFLVASVLYRVLELLLGNMDVVMTNMSSGSSGLSETRHISYSCGHTAVLLVLLGLTREVDHVLFNFLCCSFGHCHFA